MICCFCSAHLDTQEEAVLANWIPTFWHVHQLLLHAFEAFHETADSMWATIKAAVAVSVEAAVVSGHVESPRAESFGEADRFIACEEDRPVPVKMRQTKPLTLLNPDAELLDSFEP